MRQVPCPLFRPYFEALIQSLDCQESDQQCFYALSVLLSMTGNPGTSESLHSLSNSSSRLSHSCEQRHSRIGVSDREINRESMFCPIVSSKRARFQDKSFYNTIVVDRLCEILHQASASGQRRRPSSPLAFDRSSFPESNIRLVTLGLAINLLKSLVYNAEEKRSYLSDQHLARIEQAHENSTEDLRRHYRVGRAGRHLQPAKRLLGF
jgi:hypothetical protein